MFLIVMESVVSVERITEKYMIIPRLYKVIISTLSLGKEVVKIEYESEIAAWEREKLKANRQSRESILYKKESDKYRSDLLLNITPEIERDLSDFLTLFNRYSLMFTRNTANDIRKRIEEVTGFGR